MTFDTLFHYTGKGLAIWLPQRTHRAVSHLVPANRAHGRIFLWNDAIAMPFILFSRWPLLPKKEAE